MRSKKAVTSETVTQATKITPKKEARVKFQAIETRSLKCTYSTRVVVDNAPSGQRYDFQPGETKPVKAEDVPFLLSLKRATGGGCCGSTPGLVQYFEEV